MKLDEKVIFPDTVLAQELDGETVLLDMDTEQYFGLDAMGTVMWELLQEKDTLQEVLAVLLQTYDVEEDVLKKDLLDFVENLQKNGLAEG